LRAFQDDLTAGGAGLESGGPRFSEFGRRVAENASAGTDHGTAAPVFLAGARVRAGWWARRRSYSIWRAVT